MLELFDACSLVVSFVSVRSKKKENISSFWVGGWPDAKWSELATASVACLLCVFLLQMILVVIEGLGDKNGSNKLAISSTWRASAASYPHTRIAAYRAPSAHEGVWRAHLPQHYFCADALDAPAKRWRRCHPRCGN
jgi:hypothetical protein